jgi:hypothetical protein
MIFEKFNHTPDGHATQLFGIAYETPFAQHVLCTNMYEYQADWLLRVLDHVVVTGVEPYPVRGDGRSV